MRQSLAAAMVLLGYQLYSEKKYIGTIVCLIIANSFHNSAIIGILLIVFTALITRVRKKKYQVLLVTIIPISMILIFSLGINISGLFVQFGLLPERFQKYIDLFSRGNFTGKNSYYVQLTLADYVEAFFKLVFFATCFYFGMKKKVLNNSNRAYMYVVYLLISSMTYFLCLIIFHTVYGLRITWCSDYLLLIIVPYIATSGQGTISLRSVKPPTAVMYSILCIYFIIGYIYFGWHGTYPLILNM
jgi:hypothetical protein